MTNPRVLYGFSQKRIVKSDMFIMLHDTASRKALVNETKLILLLMIFDKVIYCKSCHWKYLNEHL